ncbi:MAG: type II and III secretion system protein, partial [Thermodesulfobacteria bacterium]|nr:type II and III secretion system protein [Thermodesulfobacteriota bacterium]
TAQTFLRVPNGGTVVIGGLKIAKKQEAYDRVPGVSKIPAVGNLFKNSQKNQEEQELIIFITARVISSAVEEIDY